MQQSRACCTYAIYLYYNCVVSVAVAACYIAFISLSRKLLISSLAKNMQGSATVLVPIMLCRNARATISTRLVILYLRSRSRGLADGSGLDY